MATPPPPHTSTTVLGENLVVEPATTEVERTYDTVQTARTHDPNPKQEEEQEGENENASPALAVAADTSSEDQGGGESTDAEATSLNGKLVMSSTIPGLVEKTGPLVADDIPNADKIGGRPNEGHCALQLPIFFCLCNCLQNFMKLIPDFSALVVLVWWTRSIAVIVDRFGMLLFFFQDKEIEGVPITPELASEVQKAEMQEGKDTGKGSVAARLQAAAAYNVREHVVPPVGTASLGTAREVRTSKEEKRETLKYVASGTRETKSAH
ncbi:unnamed protein product [Sphagnum balticum]